MIRPIIVKTPQGELVRVLPHAILNYKPQGKGSRIYDVTGDSLVVEQTPEEIDDLLRVAAAVEGQGFDPLVELGLIAHILKLPNEVYANMARRQSEAMQPQAMTIDEYQRSGG